MNTLVSRRMTNRLPLASWVFVAGMFAFVAGVGSPVSAQPSTGAMEQGAPVLLNDGVPMGVENVTVEQRLGNQLPGDMKLIDSKGRQFTLSHYLDGERSLILTLNYSNCPMLCNVQLNQLAQSLDQMDDLKIGEDFQLLSVSIDPTETDQRLRDTKKRYVEQVPSHEKAEEGWSFTRTTKANVERLAKEVGFSYKYNPRTKEYAHPAMLAFVSPDGVITRYSLGVAFPPDQMKLALVEAGQGNVGGIVDQFVLWCYSYDPNENSYVPQAWKLMRLGGGMTITLLGLALLPYWRGRKGSPANATDDETPDGNINSTAGPDGTSEPAPLKPTQWHLHGNAD
ncbi:SCO1/SenC family protein [Rhodopirellula islandica]|uniref:SCO1/SenC family protein n=1 Tax=Rhodopirellula islandica TaxID=595434 RepID=A0A0J1BCL5_RHOIS|nr:SCO family protein [Rhodopirellula islandica]KLU04347.1 SCO1/SenC family protein [Rhodopirellula islandica]